MNPVYVPLLAALAGGLIAAAASLGGIFVQAKATDRRERLRQAMTLAMEEWKVQVEHGGKAVLPFSSYVHHHLLVLEAVESNDLTPERLRKIDAESRMIVAALIDIDREWREKKWMETRSRGPESGRGS